MNILHQITAVIIRIFVLFLLLRLIGEIPRLFYLADYGPVSNQAYVWISMHILFVLFISYYLWRKPFSVTKKIIPKLDNSVILENVSFKQLQISALSIIGIIILIMGLSDILYASWSIQGIKGASDPGFPVHPKEYAFLYCSILESIFGLILMLGSKGIINVLHKFQNFGLENK